jgi:hypothetical protein
MSRNDGPRWKPPPHGDRWIPIGSAKTHRQRFGHLAGVRELHIPPRRHRDAWDGHDPHELAKSLMKRARSILEDPSAWPVLANRDYMDAWQREEFKHEVWQPEDLPDLLGYPLRDDKGKRLRPADRLELARCVVDLAQEETCAAQGTWRYVSKSRSFKEIDTGLCEAMPKHLTEAILTDAFTHDRKSRIKLVPRAEARAFIEKHHRYKPYVRDNGWIYSIGLYNGKRLAAVASAHSVTAGWAVPGFPKTGTPRQIPRYARYDEVDPDENVERVPLDPKNILDLSRVASDGTIKGASSMLAARILKLAPATRRGDPDGPWLFTTYSMDDEEGSTYKALKELGLRPVHRRSPRNVKSGARRGAKLRGDDFVAKIRWEAGPAAMKADPALE